MTARRPVTLNLTAEEQGLLLTAVRFYRKHTEKNIAQARRHFGEALDPDALANKEARLTMLDKLTRDLKGTSDAPS